MITLMSLFFPFGFCVLCFFFLGRTQVFSVFVCPLWIEFFVLFDCFVDRTQIFFVIACSSRPKKFFFFLLSFILFYLASDLHRKVFILLSDNTY